MSTNYEYSTAVTEAQYVRTYWFEYNHQIYNMRELCALLDMDLKQVRNTMRFPKRIRHGWVDVFGQTEHPVKQLIGPKEVLIDLHNNIERSKPKLKKKDLDSRSDILKLAVSRPWR